MAIYLEPTELRLAYSDAEVDARRYFEPFNEFERLAANHIRPNLPAHYPKVNDGTLSGQLLEIAKRVFQELHTGRFVSKNRPEPWYAEIINIIWERFIVLGAEFDADMFTKFWNMYYRCEQYGASVAFSFFRIDDNYTGADFSVDYVKDVLPEPGKISHYSSAYNWRNTYLTKLDLKNIIASAEREQNKAKADNRDSFSTWDIEALKSFVNAGPTGKEAQDKNLSEREKQLSSVHYKLATCYHRGVKAPFYTIIPSMEGKLARTRYNNDPTGDIPITVMYHTQDLVNPWGKGLVELAGANQNVLDYFTQADVLASQKGMDPPVDIHGSNTDGLVRSSIVHGPGAQWVTGNAIVKPVETTSSVYSFLQNRLGAYKTNLLNQLGSFDTSVSATAGNPQFSKTDRGVGALQGRSDVNDNFLSRNGRIAFRHLAKTLMNIHVANMRGTMPIDLDDNEADLLRKGGWPVDQQNKVLLEWSKLQGKLDFIVDEQEQGSDPEKDGLLEGIKTLGDNPNAIAQIEADGKYKVDLGEAYRQYFGKLNLTQLDKIIVPIDTKNHDGSMVHDAIAPQPGAQGQLTGAQTSRPPSESINYKDAPPDIQAQMEAAAGFQPSQTHAAELQATITPPAEQPPSPTSAPSPDQPQAEDPAVLAQEHQQTVHQYGVDPHVAQIIMAARRTGISEEDIANSLQQAQGGQ